MILKCVRNNKWPNGKITIGNIYEFDDVSKEAFVLYHNVAAAADSDAYVGSYSSYYIKDDNGEYRYFLKECFLNIQEERQKKLEQLGI